MADAPINTPQPRRRLGLRLGRKPNTTPGVRQQTKLQKTTLQSDENNDDTSATPRTLPLKLNSSSTICRRPGLARKRKDLTKKRLEFSIAENSEIVSKTPAQKISQESTNPDSNNWRQRQIAELQGDIEIWKNGFVAAMDDLQGLAQPRKSKKELLMQLGIPLEMLNYLEED